MVGAVAPSLAPSGSNEGDFLQATRVLAREIVAAHLAGTDGSPTWLRPNRSTAEGAPPLVPAGPHLYDGLAGIAVLFAALARVDSDRTYHDLSVEVVAPLRRLLARLVDDPEWARTRRLGIGGLVGVCSFAYSLATLGRLLEEPEMLDEAVRVAMLVTPERIAADRRLDVVEGAAGAILVLLTLERCVRASAWTGGALLAAADECADHLLRWAVDRPDGSVAWPVGPEQCALTGFAHGSTGIWCSLLKLHAETGRSELLTAALRGWVFEGSTYSERDRDWFDQSSSTPRFLNQWCFGAPGLTLGRLSVLDLVSNRPEGERMSAEIRDGLRITSSPRLSVRDNVCCGDMGRVEVLIYAAEKLGEPELLDAAAALARRVLAKAERRGGFEGLVPSSRRDPSLFSGEAGIGYTLLRLARPGELPCLLAME